MIVLSTRVVVDVTARYALTYICTTGDFVNVCFLKELYSYYQIHTKFLYDATLLDIQREESRNGN